MKNAPISIEVFGERLRSKQYTLHQLRKMLEAMPRYQRFEALLPVFTDPSQQRYGQYIAGKLLLSLRPRCSRSIEEILRAVAPAWDVSVEELPFYLLHVFGRERVVAAAAEVSQKYESGSAEHVTLAAIEWWLTGTNRYLKNEGGNPPPNSGDSGAETSSTLAKVVQRIRRIFVKL